MTEESSVEQQEWSQPKKFLLLFLTIYLFLYMFPFPMDQITFLESLLSFYTTTLDFVTLWVGHHLLDIPALEKIEMTGSGDSTFDYVKLLATVLISVFISCFVFIFTLKHKNYTKLYSWIIIYARYYVGLYMLLYGFGKLYDGQFIFPGISRLEQPYGNSSPMGLLWTFMGYSKSYTAFSGIGEIVGGALLFFRRTTVLGCLISIIVMLNVVMLNFSYDVPVKIFSSHLVLISLIILAPNINRLWQFFIFNKTTEISSSKLYLSKKWMRIGRLILKPLIIVGITGFTVFQDIQAGNELSTNYPLAGAYKTDVFIANRDTVSPLTTDSTRWKKMVIADDYISIITMLDKPIYYQVD